MDSISQAVLGAAVGEAVLGKKIGNRAILIGAIGGTIPDLDIISNLFLDDMNAFNFHRGITHSIFFSLVAPLLFAKITEYLYQDNRQKNKKFRLSFGILYGILVGLPLMFMVYGSIIAQSYLFILTSIVIFSLFSFTIYKYIESDAIEFDVSFKEWYVLFFGAFITHMMLDVCTTYGTQIFQPFSDYRASTNNIAVADPFYTIPFLTCLIITIFINRKNKWRARMNYLGLGISTFYLALSFFVKSQANTIVKHQLKNENIAYERMMTTPGFFNIALWSTTIETKTHFLIGSYSFFDPEPKVQNFIKIAKNHDLLAGHEDDEHVRILRRFTGGYFIIEKDTLNNQLKFADTRWGALDNVAKVPEEFRFPIYFELKKENGEYRALERQRDRDGIDGALLQSYLDRILGRWQR